MADSRDLGMAALQAGDPARAAVHLFQAIHDTPDDAATVGALGVALCQSRRLEEGLQVLRRAVELDPAQAVLQYNLGCALERLGRGMEAVGAYRRTLDLAPTHPQAVEALTRLAARGAAPEAAPEARPGMVQQQSGARDVPPAPAARAGSFEVSHPPDSAAPAETPKSPPPRALKSAPAAPAAAACAPAAGKPASTPASPAPPPGAEEARMAALKRLGVVLAVAAGIVLGAAIGTAPRQPARKLNPVPPLTPGRPDGKHPLPPPETGPADPRMVVNVEMGFSFRVPPGFPTPIPHSQSPPRDFGPSARCTVYGSTSGSTYVFVACYRLSRSAFQQLGPEELYGAAEAIVAKGAENVKRQDDAPAERRTLRYDTISSEGTRYGQALIVLNSGASSGEETATAERRQAPRMWIMGYETDTEAERESGAAQDFFHSLTISALVGP